MTDALNAATDPDVLTPKYKMGCVILASVSACCAVLSVALVIWGDTRNDSVKGLVETFSTTFKLSIGALLGFVGGKAA